MSSQYFQLINKQLKMNRDDLRSEYNEFDDLNDDKRWIPLASRMKLSTIHIIGIAFSILSYQIAYSVEFALGTPIMQRIGFGKTVISFVWASGPIAGFFVQPLVGYYSDILRSPMGRRRPFILVGSIGIIIGFALLYYVETLGSLFKSNHETWTKVFLIISIIIINIAINIMQGPCRAILGDLVPKAQQVTANTIGSVMISVAGFIGNLSGGLRISQYTHGVFTDEQIVIITGLVLIVIGIASTVLSGKEEQLTEVPARETPIKEIWHATINMPRPIFRVAVVYFFAWAAYYPFQVLATDFFARDIFHGNAQTHDKPYVDGVSFGMLVLSISSAVSIIYSAFQPKIVEYINMKYVYLVSQILVTIILLLVFFITNKYALMVLLIPLAINLSVSNSIPFTIVATCVPQEQMAVYMGVLNFFAVLGQQLAQLIIITGIGYVSPKVGYVIGSSCVFSLIGCIFSLRIETPPSGLERVDALLQISSHDPIR